MKILFISEYFPTDKYIDVHGGMEMRTFYITNYLSFKNKITVITTKLISNKKPKQIGNIFIKYAGIARSYSRIGNICSRIIFSVTAVWLGLFIEFDLVEGSGLMGWFPAYILGTLKRKKKVIVVADVSKNYLSGFLKSVISWYEIIILKKSWDKIICISQTVKNYLVKYKIKGKSIAVIYCGTDSSYSKLPEKINRDFSIICVSRLAPYKRVIDLVKAVWVLMKKYPNIKLMIIGSGEENNDIVNLIKINNLQNNIMLLGFIKKHQDVMNYIKNAYVSCLPSVVEGFGIVTIESLAQGVPVVLADIPIHHEITGNYGVLFFEPKNYIDLAKKLEIIWEDKPLYQKLRIQGYHLSKQYNWQEIAKKTEKLYEYLCSN